MHRPRLRPLLQAAPEDGSGLRFILFDRTGVSDQSLSLGRMHLELIQRFDGQSTLADIHREFAHRLSLEDAARLVEQLDQALFLDSPRFQNQLSSPIRPASCAGRAYENDADELRRRLRGLYTHPQGAGLPKDPQPDGALRAILAPHIDYTRGGLSYTFAFRELYERCPAALFVIIGTSHYSGHRFTLTRKHFQTPLGTATTDQSYIDRLVGHYGDGLFDDEFAAHMPEHSIELEVVFLQHLYEGKRDIRIVPLLVGSFHDCLRTGNPMARSDIRRMVEALRKVEAELDEPICYVISGDLAHIGPEFGDRGALKDSQLAHSQQQDQAILKAAESGDPDSYFSVIAGENDARRICGVPPTWLTLAVTGPTRGRTLHYDQYVHPRRALSVSFASMAFER